MSATVEIVVPKEQLPASNVVWLCKKLLESAEKGELRGLAIAACVAKPGAPMCTSHGQAMGEGSSAAQLVHALELSKLRVLGVPCETPLDAIIAE